MRKELIELQNQKLKFYGKLQRYGLKNQYIGGQIPTMLLTEIELDIKTAILPSLKIDHIWLNVGKTVISKDVPELSIISFQAWVKPYRKGYINYSEGLTEKQIDIGLNRISQINIKTKGEGQDFKTFWEKAQKERVFLSNKINIK
jgi:hypothetical protein